MANLNKKIRQLMDARPQYEISAEYSDNLGMARRKAYGRNRGIMNAEENIRANTASTVQAAQESGASGSDILASLASIGGGAGQAYNDLAYQEANIQDQGLQDLMTANIMMAEERDKEWNYNTNMPYQQRLSYLQQKKANKNKFWGDIIGGIVNVGSAAASGGLFSKK